MKATTRWFSSITNWHLLRGTSGRYPGARESLSLARAVFGDLGSRAVMLGLVNINSPLRLDERMAETLLEYAKAGQGVLLTPGILMGVTAPVTAAGALAQAARPGAPVIIGTGGFGSDLRTGGPGFGRPENALGTALGAQLARRVGLPFRCSGGVTGSRLPDCRSGYERMMTALAAWSSGAHVCLQGAGTLDSITSMSYEQFLIDVEIWGYLRRLSQRPAVTDETLAVDLAAALPADYLGTDHTVEHMAEMGPALLATPKPYDEWLADGAPDVVALASQRLLRGSGNIGTEPLEGSRKDDLDRWVAERRKALSRA